MVRMPAHAHPPSFVTRPRPAKRKAPSRVVLFLKGNSARCTSWMMKPEGKSEGACPSPFAGGVALACRS